MEGAPPEWLLRNRDAKRDPGRAFSTGAFARVLGEAGKQYAIYIHRGRVSQDQKPQYQVDDLPHTARLVLHLPQRNYRYAWVDPKSGQTVSEGVLAQAGETYELQSPEYREDIALRILAGAGKAFLASCQI